MLRAVFGRGSLHVATAQEDLAYALYVLEYSSGRFYKAREHAERAIRIIEVRGCRLYSNSEWGWQDLHRRPAWGVSCVAPQLPVYPNRPSSLK